MTIDTDCKLEPFSFQRLAAFRLGAPDSTEPLHQLVDVGSSEPVALLLDQYENIDHFMRETKMSDDLIAGLAQKSVLTKKFVALLIARDNGTAVYERVLAVNGGQKIRAVFDEKFRWEKDELRLILEKHIQLAGIDMPEESVKQMLGRSETPAQLLDEFKSYRIKHDSPI